jgi:hypothetical protein
MGDKLPVANHQMGAAEMLRKRCFGMMGSMQDCCWRKTAPFGARKQRSFCFKVKQSHTKI